MVNENTVLIFILFMIYDIMTILFSKLLKLLYCSGTLYMIIISGDTMC